VVTVSGAGYDLDDQTTYDLGAERSIYLNRFGEPGEPGVFDEGASVVEHLDPSDPPFLVFYAEREYESLQHQAKLFYRDLQEAGVTSELLTVPGQGHRRIVVTLSQADHPMTGQVLDFIRRRSADCPAAHPAR
jgi:dipeptidyl aminopeptidase/acylaminoacyl peptidase